MCVDNYAEQSRCVEVLRNRIRELERENAEARRMLADGPVCGKCEHKRARKFLEQQIKDGELVMNVVPYDLCRCVECGWQEQFRRDCIAEDGRVDGHCDRCREERTFYRHNAGGLERENAEVRSALEGIMPFVEEDYMPDYATPAFKAAVEKARAALGRKEG